MPLSGSFITKTIDLETGSFGAAPSCPLPAEIVTPDTYHDKAQNPVLSTYRWHGFSSPLWGITLVDDHGRLRIVSFIYRGRDNEERPPAELVPPEPVFIQPSEDLAETFFAKVGDKLQNPLINLEYFQLFKEAQEKEFANNRDKDIRWTKGSNRGLSLDFAGVVNAMGAVNNLPFTDGSLLAWFEAETPWSPARFVDPLAYWRIKFGHQYIYKGSYRDYLARPDAPLYQKFLDLLSKTGPLFQRNSPVGGIPLRREMPEIPADGPFDRLMMFRRSIVDGVGLQQAIAIDCNFYETGHGTTEGLELYRKIMDGA